MGECFVVEGIFEGAHFGGLGVFDGAAGFGAGFVEGCPETVGVHDKCAFAHAEIGDAAVCGDDDDIVTFLGLEYGAFDNHVGGLVFGGEKDFDVLGVGVVLGCFGSFALAVEDEFCVLAGGRGPSDDFFDKFVACDLEVAAHELGKFGGVVDEVVAVDVVGLAHGV